MSLRTTCPNCQSSYNVNDVTLGKKVRCNSCGKTFLVRQGSSSAAAVEERLTQTPSQPGNPKPIPTVLPVSSEPDRATTKNGAADLNVKNLPVPPRRRTLPLIFLGLLVFGGGGLLLTCGGAAIGFGLYLYRSPAKTAVAQQPTTEEKSKLAEKQPEPQPAGDFNITEVRKSVVYIKRLNSVGTAVASGTGFFVSSDGLIYTNRHVIQGDPPQFRAELQVGVPSRKDPKELDYFKAAVVYVSPQTDSLDFAILKITPRPDYGDFPKLTLATDKPGLGAPVAAVGYPGINDINQPKLSFNKGAISADGPVVFDKKNYYQTDAAINPGNSGGPLVNARGEVVAIVTLKKNNANNMSYALQLSEIETVAKPTVEQLAKAQPEAGPIDLKALPQATSIPPEAAKWVAGLGQIRELTKQGTHYLTVDGNGGVFWMTTREELPENFQLTAFIGVEPYIGGYRAQASQRSLLATLLIRFATADTGKNILMDKSSGYLIKSTYKYTQLSRDKTDLHTEQTGHPDEVFQLTIIRRNGEIIVQADEQVLLRQADPNPLPGRAKLSIGGFLARLYVIGDVKIMALDGKEPMGPIIVKKDPNKNGIDLAKPGPEDAPKPPEKLAENERLLPGTADSVCQGGGGRFLILHLAKERKLAIFDANESKVVKYIPLGEDNVKFAAGLDKLFVILPTTNTIQRWSLTTFERELSVASPLKSTVEVALMGSASQGPLLIGGGDEARDSAALLLDTKTLNALPTQVPSNFGSSWRCRVSADGRLFTSYMPDSSPQRHQWYLLQADNTLKSGGFDRSGNVVIEGHAAPSPDGRYIFSAKGVFTADGKPVGDLGRDGLYAIPPAEGGTFYLNLNGGVLTLHIVGEAAPIATLDVQRLEEVNTWDREKLPNDMRYFFVPSAKLLAFLPPTADRLLVYKVDIEQLLTQSGHDFLVATGRPPATATRGATYSFALGVLSKKGNVKYKVEAGPKGMAVAADGKLTWTVPADFADGDTDVIVTVSDASGREILVSFKVHVASETVAVKPPDKGPPDKPVDPPPTPPTDKPPITANALAIKVAPLKADHEERPLPASVDNVCVGGAGRFLIFHMGKERKVAIFDVNEAKVVKYLPVAEDNVKIAACLDKLLVVLPASNTIQRYSLTTFERELSVAGPSVTSISVALMGSASHGPLLVQGENGSAFLDPYTLKSLPNLKLEDGPNSAKGLVFRMSADGRTVTHYMPDSSPQQHTVYFRQGDVYKRGGLDRDAAGMMAPGPESRYVYTARGLYTTDGKPSGKHGSYNDGSRYCLPAAEGETFYLRINVPGFPHGDRQMKMGQLYLHLHGDDSELAAIDGAQIPTGINTWGREAFGIDQHFFLVPSAQLLVLLSPTRDRLLLYRIDVEKMLEKSNRDYLVVLSRAPDGAVRGSRFSYTPVVKAKKGGVKVKVESGPIGMKVGADGQVTWDVPNDFADKQFDVVLSVSDAAGQEKFHSFRLSIVDNSPLATPAPK